MGHHHILLNNNKANFWSADVLSPTSGKAPSLEDRHVTVALFSI